MPKKAAAVKSVKSELTYEQAMALRIDDLVLTVRTAHRLGSWKTIGDVIDVLEGRPVIERLKNFGRRAARELHEQLAEVGAPQRLLDRIATGPRITVSLQVQFEKLVAKAHREGIAVVVDADAVAIRLIPRYIVDLGDDLRQLGAVVRVHGGCGGGAPLASGRACNDGNL